MQPRFSPQARRRRILELLAQGGTWQVNELARRLGCSPSTIRRDLTRLHAESSPVQRGWGSVSLERSPAELAFAAKLRVERAAKEAIARAVAQRVHAGQVLFLNGGTTTTLVARALAASGKPLTVVTNAVNVAYELVAATQVNVVVLGGSMRPQNYELVGPTALATLAQFHANVAILGCNGLSPAMGASTVVEAEAEVSRGMAQRADEVWVVADHTKLGRSALATIVPTQAIRYLFTDRVDGGLLAQLRGIGEVVLCPGERQETTA